MLVSSFCLLFVGVRAQTDWKPVEGKIVTLWASQVNPEQPLPEYPRPHMVRENWQNLNGLWDYAIAPEATGKDLPAAYEGEILVPFAIESALSWGRQKGRRGKCVMV